MENILTTSCKSKRRILIPILDTKNHSNIEMMSEIVDNSRQDDQRQRNEFSLSDNIKLSKVNSPPNLLKRKQNSFNYLDSAGRSFAVNNKKNKTDLKNQQALTSNGRLHSSHNKRNQDDLKLTGDIENLVTSKPPISPKSVLNPVIPPRWKRQLDDNAKIIEKLNNRSEKLRLEISELRTALAVERNAVRELRARNEAESRKSNKEIKKLQAYLEASKKTVKDTTDEHCNANSTKGHLGKLTQEIAMLKDANRILEGKIQAAIETERCLTSDYRSLKDSYEIRLTQITKSAKTEINRLLEEIKSNERNIGKLKKEIDFLHTVTNEKKSSDVHHPLEFKKHSYEISNLQIENENFQKENQSLKIDLELANHHIKELEITSIKVNEHNTMVETLQERIGYLEKREENLQKQTIELLEQNELFEFRIIELEGNNDKVNLDHSAILPPFMPSPFFMSDSMSSKIGSKIVATILPYNTTLSQDLRRKTCNWQSENLHESGVFEGDLDDSHSQSTQTYASDFLCHPNNIRKEAQNISNVPESAQKCVVLFDKPELAISSDQKKLEYYKDRLNFLEEKLAVYESSGDQQQKKLADRLQREIKLEIMARDYEQQNKVLIEEIKRLEEEKCELEEVENDTRLKFQRLEIDLEILIQQKQELDISRHTAVENLHEKQQRIANLEDLLVTCRNKLEKQERKYKKTMELIKSALPAIILFNIMVKTEKNSVLLWQRSNALELDDKLHQLMAREHELMQTISELNRAYNETLESADNLWALMEKDYKDRIEQARGEGCLLKAKIGKLEERMAEITQSAMERLNYLEENEVCYKNRICKLNKANKELLQKNEFLLNYKQKVVSDHNEIKLYLEGTVQPNFEREKVKNRKLEEHIAALNKMLFDTEEAHVSEIQNLRNKIASSGKELLHIEVTNAELKEEVCTLEARISELVVQRHLNEEKIRNLTDEFRNTTEDLNMKCSRVLLDAPNLAEEMTTNGGFIHEHSTFIRDHINDVDVFDDTGGFTKIPFHVEC